MLQRPGLPTRMDARPRLLCQLTAVDRVLQALASLAQAQRAQVPVVDQELAPSLVVATLNRSSVQSVKLEAYLQLLDLLL
jgi:hypothetical protein